MADEADQRAMEAADNSRTGGIIEMPVAVPNPLEAGGVMAAPEAGKGRPRRRCRELARKDRTPDYWYYGRNGHRESECWKKRVDSGRAEWMQIGVNDHTVLKAQGEPDQTLPSS